MIIGGLPDIKGSPPSAYKVSMMYYKRNGTNFYALQTIPRAASCAAESFDSANLIRCARRTRQRVRRGYKGSIQKTCFTMASGQGSTGHITGRPQFKTYQRSLLQNKNARDARAIQSNIAPAEKSVCFVQQRDWAKCMGEILELANQTRDQGIET